MPVTNEVHAPYYIKGKIVTPVYAAGHSFRLYFKTGTTMSEGAVGDEENWKIFVDGDEVGTVQNLLQELGTRLDPSIPDNSHFAAIEVWQSIPDAPNILVHLNPPPIANTYGTGAGIASSQIMFVFGTALRPTFRLSVFDGPLVAPQRYAGATPPVEDDGSLAWLMIRHPYALANNDGLKLTRMISSNTGYNNALKKRYGRIISP